jgi:hypothetical protein
MSEAIARRHFLEIFGGSTTLIGVDARYESGPVFALHQFLLDNGEQLGRLHTYLKSALLPALRREAGGAQIVLEAMVAAHQPQVVFLQQFADVAAWRDVSLKLKQNEELLAANQVWDKSGNPFLSHSLSLLAATDYSEPITNASEQQRIFEMRVYQAPSEWQLNGVHERFAGPEIPIFHRCGIHPVLYATTIAGPQMPNLTYLTPFESLAAREAAWTKFQGDPEWHRVRQQSIDNHGFTPRVITISLFKAAAYSPVR